MGLSCKRYFLKIKKLFVIRKGVIIKNIKIYIQIEYKLEIEYLNEK